MGVYVEEEYGGVKRRVFKVESLEEGITAIQRGEDAVKFDGWRVEKGDMGAKQVAEVLKDNRTLKLLDLRSNNIGPEGAGSLAEAFKVNSSLTSLNLWNNYIGDAGAGSLAEALKVNSSLTELNLRHNKIADAGAGWLGEALKVNSSLTSLDLYANNIADEGAGSLAEALKVNSSLTSLDFQYNNISVEGAGWLGEALKVNSSLTELNLGSNSIGDEGAGSLAEALKVNSSLTSLNIDVESPEIQATLSRNKVRGRLLEELRREEEAKRRKENDLLWESRTVDTVVRRYSLLVNLKAHVEELRASHILTTQHGDEEQESLFVFFQRELACQELMELSQFLRQWQQIQDNKTRFQRLQTRVVEDQALVQERDRERVSLVNALASVVTKPWRKLVKRLEEEKLTRWRSRIQVSDEHDDDLEVNADELSREVAIALEEIGQWKERHNPEQWKQRTEDTFARLRKASSQEGFDLWDRESLFSVDDQIVESFHAFKAEEMKLEKDDPSSDWPQEITDAVVNKLQSFVRSQFARTLQQVLEKIAELEKDYTFFSTGLEPPRTDRMKQLRTNLHDIEDQREELGFSLKKIQKQRVRGNPIDETEVQSLEAQLERLDKSRLSHSVATERAHLMEYTSNHYPELLNDDDFRTRLGLNELAGGDDLFRSGLYMDSLARDDFVTESNISQSPGKVVDIVCDSSGHRKVLKTFLLIRAEAQRHFVRQCSTFSKLRHANIVRVEAVFTDDKFGYILMPLYPGGDLEKWMGIHPAETRDATVCKQIAFDILNGLYTIHSHGHVHCDLKPGNVLLTQTNRAVIGDFDGVKMENRTVTSNMQVTLRYVAPELSSGDARSVSTSADMYSFGLILEDLFPEADAQCRGLIDSLLSADPKLRPSAYDSLAHEFFCAKPEAVRDCSMCFDKVRESMSVSCGGGHACCESCLYGWLQGGVPKPRVSPKADVMCFDPGCGEIFTSADLFGLKNKDIGELLLAQVKEVEQLKLQQEFEVRLEQELSKTVDDLLVMRHRNHILNEILTLACPNCKRAFVDFDACFAISCEDSEGNGCGTKFCAWCLKNCGTDSQAAHHHVATCARNRSRQDDAFFGDHNLRELEMKRLRAERLNRYWAEKVSGEGEPIQRKLKEILRNFHDRIDLNVLNAELM